MAKETAEKKLLKLIETTQAQEAAASTPPGTTASGSATPVNEAQQVLNSVKGPGLSLPKLALPSFVNQILGLFKGGSPAISGPGAFGLKDINKILTVGIVIMASLLFFNFLSGWNGSQKTLSFTVEQMSGNMEGFAPNIRELKDYLTTLTRRNIFQPFEEKVAQKGEAAALQTALTPLNERLKDLKLVGISWLDTPESASAMIENTQSGVTYFLKSGEQINSVTVKQIYADSIIIRLGDEEMEMRL